MSAEHEEDEGDPGDEDGNRDLAGEGEEFAAYSPLKSEDADGDEGFGGSIDKNIDHSFGSEFFIELERDIEHFTDHAEEREID